MGTQFAPPMMAATHPEPDIMDIDIDMDVDLEPIIEMEPLEEGEAEPETSNIDNSIVPAIYNEDPADEPLPDRVHIRGVDEFHTSDILTFAHDHFSTHDPLHIQWIDDTSANIVYPSHDIALQALLSFTLTSFTAADISISPFEFRTAKSHATRPASMLQVRVAKISDKKKKGAKDASRYYLLHPDQDPRERMRKEFEATNRNRRGDSHGDYQRRRYDDREHRRRRDNDAAMHGGDTNGDFSASMYDDAPASGPELSSHGRGRDLFARTSNANTHRRPLNRSASPSRNASTNTNSDSIDISSSDESDRVRRRSARKSRFRSRSPPPHYSRRDPHPFPADNAAKELFPSSKPSTSGLRSDSIELFPSPTIRENGRGDNSKTAANLNAARKLKAELLQSPRSQNHRRSNAMDAANEEDLAQRFGRKTLAESNKGKELFGDELGSEGGINIKGAATDQGMSIKGSGGLAIKGAAATTKELFPNLYQKGGVGNEGKELFSDKIRTTSRRTRADDLFH